MFKPSDNLAASEEHSARQTPEFSKEQRKFLLGIARAAIAMRLAGHPLPEEATRYAAAVFTRAALTSTPFTLTSSDLAAWPALYEPRGVFTTLYLHGELRGCVGYAAAVRPLFRAVAETACAAAFEDSRFWPLAPEEAPQLKISLSVLSPLFPIEPGQVEVGRHGLVISDGLRRGLLLPQVPVEHGWDRETFLRETCRKAGLPGDAWRRSGTIEAFVAEVFGDEDVGD